MDEFGLPRPPPLIPKPDHSTPKGMPIDEDDISFDVTGKLGDTRGDGENRNPFHGKSGYGDVDRYHTGSRYGFGPVIQRMFVALPRYPSKGFNSIRQFKAAFLSACEANGIEEDAQRKTILMSQLQGFPLDSLLQMSEKLNDCTISTSKLLDDLSEVVDFLPTNRLSQTEFRSCLRRQDEKFEDFAKRVRVLGMSAFPELSPRLLENFLVDRFIEGLGNPDIQFEMRKGSFNSLPEAVSQAHVMKTALEHRYGSGRGRQYRSEANYLQMGGEESDSDGEFVAQAIQVAPPKPLDRGAKAPVKPSGIDELKTMVAKVIDGVDSVKRDMAENFSNVDKRFEFITKKVNANSEAIMTLRKGHTDLQDKLGKLEANASGQLPRGMLYVPDRMNEEKQGRGGGSGNLRTCYNCGSPDHIARFCPHPRANHISAEIPKNEERPWVDHQ